MLTNTNNINRSISFEPNYYRLQKSQEGPKHSRDVVTMGGSQYSIGYTQEPLVYRHGGGKWEPVTSFEDAVTLIHEASEPDQNTEIGTWKDSYILGIYRDGEIQDKEVSDLFDRNAWDSYLVADGGDGNHYRAFAQPQEVRLARQNGKSAILEVPLDTQP